MFQIPPHSMAHYSAIKGWYIGQTDGMYVTLET